MVKFMKKCSTKILSVILVITFILSQASVLVMGHGLDMGGSVLDSYLSSSDISKVTDSIQSNIQNYLDGKMVYQLPAAVKDEDVISLIVMVDARSLLEGYTAQKTAMSFGEYAATNEAQAIAANILNENKKITSLLDKNGVAYTVGEQYNTVLSGFEINLKAKDFETVGKLLASSATVIVGDVYEPAATTVVDNIVDVYETGIFDSSSSKFQGDGVVVAVLDTGLDYTHTAFDPANFSTSKEAFTLSSIAQIIGETTAAGFTSGLTASDVYINKKVPYAYDYADKDADVFPINSDHGTHVAGVIAGQDDVITGVAPNAQLAIMKVFSDFSTGAKTSWLIAALEDCVKLGVDVINMSLGTSCGFAREVDKQNINELYDSIRAAGISLITAASNDNNATYGSDKNGSNPLTSNPDSGTVGSPSTYGASMSVASVDGVKTPYLLHEGQIIYFNEASTSSAETKDFVADILKTVQHNGTYDFPYVTIPGIGRSSDYPVEDTSYYAGKIVLVKRGTTTFEEKIRIALQDKGAAGIIIYNNVSGTISMSVGANIGAACSISQDDGERLAAVSEGVLRISISQTAGPFMSSFSSWGPTSDLQIKPEITGHGGEILSAIPGQDYDRLSGTSMACPNVAGAVALIREYVKEGYFGENLTLQEVTAVVNRLMMSTADIIYEKNGMPASIRKQGAGLVNIARATSSLGYITTYNKKGEEMDKTKFELGDDKNKTGVYTMTFTVNNFGASAMVYDIGGIIMTEGVSTTYTSYGDTTVTMEGNLLSGAVITVEGVEGGSLSGNTVTVSGNSRATVTVKVTLSHADKKYMDESFEHGMYVEGYITLTSKDGSSVNMNVPLLAFYGDWTEAPIFDEEYYDTHKDEINKGLNEEDKLKPDAYATRVIGGLYSDYIATLGTYYFTQDPKKTQIAADKNHIAISNQEGDDGDYTVCSIRSINAGFLRNVKELNISIVDVATGKVIYNETTFNHRKSFSQGNTVYPNSIDIDFYALEQNLKNNTQYEVTLTAYIDYGEKEEQNNVRDTFTFPLYVDFEAPVVTDVNFRTEYDRTTKKTSLYADLQIYDNHYAMGVQVGQIIPAEEGSDYMFTMQTFGKYVTPVYSSFNSTTTVTIELTEYVNQLKNSAGISYESGTGEVQYNTNTFIAMCYDYAMNSATYEISLPDDILYMYFGLEEVDLSPNETLDLRDVLNIYPGESWMQILDFSSDDPTVADIVNQTVVARKSGLATITASGTRADGTPVTASLQIKVLGEGDEGYNGSFTIPAVNKFELTGYETVKAYYSVDNDEREIGVTGGSYEFINNEYKLSMFPSETVKLTYVLDSYLPDDTEVVYAVGNSNIASVSEDGTIVANTKGNTVVQVAVKYNGKTQLTKIISVSVKDPFTTNSIYLMSYRGNGGEVIIPADRGVTTIYSYAFSGYEYVDKDPAAGDVIDEEDPYLIKQSPLGEDTITKIVIPEGVTTIEAYAFAGLTALEEVVFPTTLTKIGINAFDGCTSLKTLSTKVGDTVHTDCLDYVKFINKAAFKDCVIEEVSLRGVVAVGDYAFENCKLNYMELPASCQSIGAYAFSGNKALTSVDFAAYKIKLGNSAFEGCENLQSIDVNAAVIGSFAFYDCKRLTNVTLGADVAVIGEYAFTNTGVSRFTVDAGNPNLKTNAEGTMILNAAGDELILVAPNYAGQSNTVTLSGITTIGAGAFAGNKKIFTVIAPDAKKVGAYAFAFCTNLTSVSMDGVETIGNMAFLYSGLKSTPDLSKVTSIGDQAFAYTEITSATIADGAKVGKYAFAYCVKLKNVTIGNGVNIGEGAFFCPVDLYNLESTGSFNLNYYTPYLYEVKDAQGNVIERHYYYSYDFTAGTYSTMTGLVIGENVTIGDYAFYGNGILTGVTLGDGAKIGNYAFFNNASLKNIDLSGVISIGDYAFAGSTAYQVSIKDGVADSLAYEKVYLDGEVINRNLCQTGFAPCIETVDLSSIEKLGIGAFANNKELTNVSFGDKLTAVPERAFTGCSALTDVALPGSMTNVKEYAFYATALENINLGAIETIGEGAFAFTNLRDVALKAGVVLEDYAFGYCYYLADVIGMETVSSFGAYSFYASALERVELDAATYIGDYAFADSKIKEVVLGGRLVELGENPFVGCAVKTYGRYEDVTVNNQTVGRELTEDYDVSDTVKVIGGVLYQVVPKGLELVSYPMAAEAMSYTVVDGTVRISGMAFTESALHDVIFPISLKAIGDKAFYACDKLRTVTFTGVNAPILEEAYDASYVNENNLPITGNIGGYEGLGISKYYMWNVTSGHNTFYFGANFVDYIGRIDTGLVMVYPANGNNYNTMILDQYFATKLQGKSAPLESTLKVIEMINALPKSITLSDEAAVVAARNAYNALPSTEQQSLVTNFANLTAAETTIEFLKQRLPVDNPPVGPDDPTTPTDPDTPVDPGTAVDPGEPANDSNVLLVVIVSVASVCVIAIAVGAALYLLGRKKSEKDENADREGHED